MPVSESGGGIIDPSRLVNRLIVLRSIAENPVVGEIVNRSGIPAEVVDEADLPSLIPGRYPDNLGQGKRLLLLCSNRGEFLKHCPSTKQYRCCGYQVINIGTGCPMDCTYCILQAYLNTPYLSFFVNLDQLFVELDEKLRHSAAPILRIGTGEFTDSLGLDRITGLSRKLVDYFARQPRAVLELKTKSAFVDNLQGLDHRGRTILAWSLNSPQVAASEERWTASLRQRLAAAAQCAAWGYPLAFHFDPIIDHDHWQDGYRQTIDLLFAHVPAAAIRWISLGAFRFIPRLKQIGTDRFSRTTIYHREFIVGLDDKQRYVRPRRVVLYRFLYEALRRRADPRTCIYFCMESDEIWKEVTGCTPEEQGGLPAMLDRTVAGDWGGGFVERSAGD